MREFLSSDPGKAGVMLNLAVLNLAVLSGTEMVMILAVVLLLFGARKLPELARAMGTSINEFKRGMKDGKEEEAAAAAAKDKTTVNAEGESRH